MSTTRVKREPTSTNTLCYTEGEVLLGLILELPWGWCAMMAIDEPNSAADFETFDDAERWLQDALDVEVAS